MYKSLVAPSHPNCDLIMSAIADLKDKARLIYGNAVVEKISQLDIQFYDKGRNAAFALTGIAKEGPNKGKTVALIQFSMQLSRRAIVTMVNEIVPHEFAHILCMANGLDDGHGPLWKSMCIALGGTGETHHKLATLDGRMKNLYEALDDTGFSCWLTLKQVRYAAAAGIVVADEHGRHITLTKRHITGNMRKV